ncbi:UPF0149 family protein [Enterobacter kobei]|uniref:UPF0149 family protein n=1 Tax=Enterobacter kobei TaxID=208224 RepID=UPI00224A71C7|nr:UPF0149 family protein [Enterobacter kobei]UZQ66098.1 UPF0149 family protein [Enterobacter kobei]
MKLTKSGPLIDREIDWLEEVLLKYGNDDSVLCFSELDGFLTAVVSGPNTISPNTWLSAMEVAIKWSAAPDMTPQTVLYRRPVAQFSNFQPKIVSSWLILALFQANFLISGRSRLCPYQLVNSNQVRQGE